MNELWENGGRGGRSQPLQRVGEVGGKGEQRKNSQPASREGVAFPGSEVSPKQGGRLLFGEEDSSLQGEDSSFKEEGSSFKGNAPPSRGKAPSQRLKTPA